LTATEGARSTDVSIVAPPPRNELELLIR